MQSLEKAHLPVNMQKKATSMEGRNISLQFQKPLESYFNFK